MKSYAYCCLAVFILVGIGLLAWHISGLPEQIATHFNGQGVPDGFMSRTGYALMMLSLLVGMPLFLVGITKASSYLPESMINMPNRDYWLHRSRRKTTMDTMEVVMIWISCITELLFIGLAQLTYDANIRQGNLSTLGFGVLLTFYLIAIGFCVVWMLWRFRLPSDTADVS